VLLREPADRAISAFAARQAGRDNMIGSFEQVCGLAFLVVVFIDLLKDWHI
jgi:hypothetical protein